MKLNRIAIGGVAGIMGLGLIGIGAHAAFTTATTSQQTITAGTLSLVLHATPAHVLSGTGTKTLTLNPLTNQGSSFTTSTVTITIHNAGSLTAKLLTATPSDTYNGTASTVMANEVYMCEVSTGEVIYNGPLHSAPAQTIHATLASGATTHYMINVYAGTETTACGAVTTPGQTAVFGKSSAPSLTNTAEGGVITPKLTVTATA